MKFFHEYRNPKLAQQLVATIQRTSKQRWTIMEVCGGQTHGLLRYGIDEALVEQVELVHGPGCPVCVTGVKLIDAAIELAFRPNIQLVTFGDMLRVPGSATSLAAARAAGAQVTAVYSPLDAVTLAENTPAKEIVFFAVGFETTAPATALAVLQAQQKGVRNFSMISAHVRVQPAMDLLMQSPGQRVQGFLAAGHVCAVLGYESYAEFCRQFRVPVVVTGFEPVDLLTGILACIMQLNDGQYEVTNSYGRSVSPVGNRMAQELMQRVYEPCDRLWRGMNVVPRGGLQFRPEWKTFDALYRHGIESIAVAECSLCRSGEILAGKLKPPQCKAFGKECTPLSPLGAPMVSSEGACAAYFAYHVATPKRAAPETAL